MTDHIWLKMLKAHIILFHIFSQNGVLAQRPCQKMMIGKSESISLPQSEFK